MRIFENVKGAFWQRLALLSGAFAICLSGPAFACRLALLLALDVSSSIDDEEYVLQRDGLTSALLAPEVVSAFFATPEPVALAAYEWSGQNNQQLLVDWRLINSAADLELVAGTIRKAQPSDELDPTALGNALRFGIQQIGRAPNCRRQTIDVSGDGKNNDGYPPAVAYRHFPVAGITINALAIGGAQDLDDLIRYFHEHVILGFGAFVENANDHSDFHRAMKRKLERELTSLAISWHGP